MNDDVITERSDESGPPELSIVLAIWRGLLGGMILGPLLVAVYFFALGVIVGILIKG